MRLAAVAYLVRDYDEALAFFVGGLGWELTADLEQGPKRWVTVRAGEVELVLARADGAAQDAALAAPIGGRVGLFLKTDDFARDRARIEAAGGVFEETPRHESYGTVAVWRDPFGMRWDLIEPT